MTVHVGACDKFRQTSEGEAAWQDMMATRQEITEEEFLAACDVSAVLDEDETWEQYKDAWRSDPIRFYKSPNGLYHFQTAGFELIWRQPDLLVGSRMCSAPQDGRLER